ncbi:hypothetical protein CALCODRAFT_59109 [Calocera cornea HHB12733]|uniref:Uncharacterized protein n=1 Tax=Calocera cornea HHB12733 TaxID=1353952 RepID=A0A165IWP9_9BASI|nr:hypothetical protein CALCODRAFT_59109 [Calocera cornea HHB12733]
MSCIIPSASVLPALSALSKPSINWSLRAAWGRPSVISGAQPPRHISCTVAMQISASGEVAAHRLECTGSGAFARPSITSHQAIGRQGPKLYLLPSALPWCLNVAAALHHRPGRPATLPLPRPRLPRCHPLS